MKIEGNYEPIVVYGLKFLDRVIYVGQCEGSVKQRVYKHFSNALRSSGRGPQLCPKLYEFIRNNQSKDDYTLVILERTNRENVSARERHWIAEFDTKNNGMNVTAGGRTTSGSDHYLYGKPACKAAVAASVKARLGKKLTPEHIAKIRQGHQRRENKTNTD